ncbi:hypothetical protein Salmuc_02696 [Salipiger mucosus DSM 16094]|uniref:Uncharacterized protein n=1 Tax=Salipiger mucosus DSM 16094 TaxID=1123237 RepID=S9R0C3_9RHOB|nr:hypothetical protein Salmuc_02696 [Salipiger mucosus DSM 16094]
MSVLIFIRLPSALASSRAWTLRAMTCPADFCDRPRAYR